jgi:hypothetical protein
MRYRLWLNNIELLNEKLNHLIVDKELLTEEITIKNNGYKVCLGSNVTFYKNGEKDTRGFSGDYLPKEKGWITLLNGLQTKITLAEALNGKMIESIAQTYLPEAVANRLVSGNDIPDNKGIIEFAAGRRIEQLTELFPEQEDNYSYNLTFKVRLPDRDFSLQVNSVSWRGVSITLIDRTLNGTINFLTYFDEIKEKIIQLIPHYIAIINAGKDKPDKEE